MLNKKFIGLSSILFVMIVWGSSYPVTKIIINDVAPLTLAFCRCSVGAVTLLLTFFITKDKPIRAYLIGVPWPYIIFMGLSGVTCFYTLFNLSAQMTSASVGSLIQGFIPVCIALFAAVFLKEKLSAVQVIGIIASLIGVMLIGFLSSDNNTDTRNSITGNLLMIVAVVSWAAYTIMSKKAAHFNPLLITSLSTLVGSACLLPAAIFENRYTGWPVIHLNSWLVILYLGAVSSGICYFLYSKSLRLLTASQVGNFANLDPVVGLLISLIFLNEHINILQIAGAVLVLGGIVLSTRRSQLAN
ncbi:DMT family transporter [Mucilaginibacter sp. SG564]|uniref:DMT family transporter n=1 Tax=unclassified Mucilaginibacter TaxID=2617802 RepID=UPI001557BB10|nr:DMT family transporter [Mucilaginibacter sp. SG564]NOW97809.1 drug/metabolite transporter (DMT)-like permease [Mucilaginibacter sp. SG564]